jgi:hypothetical protein
MVVPRRPGYAKRAYMIPLTSSKAVLTACMGEHMGEAVAASRWRYQHFVFEHVSIVAPAFSLFGNIVLVWLPY